MSPKPRAISLAWISMVTIVLVLLWGINRLYYNRYEMPNPVTPVYHTVLRLLRPYFTHVNHETSRIVWTRVSSESQPTGAPWHRDWLITVTGDAHNPWRLHPLTIDVYVNGQHGGIEGWFIPLTSALHLSQGKPARHAATGTAPVIFEHTSQDR